MQYNKNISEPSDRYKYDDLGTNLALVSSTPSDSQHYCGPLSISQFML